ncbi:MAG: saccharopine dehydrogenase C-terminal domain-containing protein [Chitinophagaceae bacterium]
MTNILILGAGKSSAYLVQYLLGLASKKKWFITVADANLEAATDRIGNSSDGVAIQVDILDESARKRIIADNNLVISLLPPHLHYLAAIDCLTLRRNLITASYLSDEIKAMHSDVEKAGLLFMNEMGLDPGIDHMSAMKIIHGIEKVGGELYSFKSYCGGLMSPESDNNPWHYKISWNPNNIVNAGKNGAEFKLHGFNKHIEYKNLFSDYDLVEVPQIGQIAAYPNRDSLNYMSLYGLKNIKTMLRATFRYEPFCIAWHVIVNLGLTNQDEKINVKNLNWLDWFMYASRHVEGQSPQEKIKHISANPMAYELLNWLGLFSNDNILLPIPEASHGYILQHLLEQRWKMDKKDKDLIVMHHIFEFNKKDMYNKLTSTLIVKGEDKTFTAMAKTVGLPMAIFANLVLSKKIDHIKGVHIPVMKEVYKPVLKELEDYDINFIEHYDL